MNSNMKWTIVVGLVASLLAASLMAWLTKGSGMSVLAWAVFFETLQLPMIAAARRGRIDPCTAWLRRKLSAR